MAGKQPGARGGKKGRKIGRNKVKCERYLKQGRWERNKLRRLRKHVRHQPNDDEAKAAIETLRLEHPLLK